MRWLLLLPVFTLACNRDKGGETGGSDDTSGSDSLTLGLAVSTASAGETVGYVLLYEHDGQPEEVAADSLSSSLEDALDWDAGSLTPVVAGDAIITATATIDGEPWTATAPLEVLAGEAVSLELALSATSFPAGESATYALTAMDAYGNALDTSGASVGVDSDAVEIAGDTVSSVTPGTYSLVATMGALSDDEWFTVTPGAAASVTLSLSDMELEVGDSTVAQVEIRDAYENLTDDTYTLGVEGTGTATLDGTTIGFPEEGAYTVTATVDGSDLSASVGPLYVDSSGPELSVDTPERGTWTEDDAGTVSGSVSESVSGLDSFTVNGASVEVADDGTFSTSVAWDFGLNVVETSATDGDGNNSTDTRAVLAGDFLDYGATAPGGMLARIDEGAGGLDELESLGEGLVAATDLDALIPSPAYSYYEETCIDYWFGEECWDWYSVKLYITSPRIGSTDLQLDPMSTGQLSAVFTVYSPSLNWSANGDVVGIGYSGSGTITADSITVALVLTPSVTDGTIHTTVDSVTVSSSGFDFDFDSWLYDALDYVGVDIDGLIQGYIEDAIEGVVYDEVPAVLESALQDLEIGYSFTVDDHNYAFTASPDGVTVDDAGVTLSLGTTFQIDSWEASRSGLGSLYYGYGTPTWTGIAGGTSMGVSADFLNQVFYSLWGGNLLNFTMTDEELGLDPADLALVLPGLTDLTVTTEALLPPVVVPGTGDDLLDLQVGDLLLTLYNGPAESGYEYIQVYVSAVAGLGVSATSDATLSAEIGDTTLYFDVVYPDASSVEAGAIEEMLQMLVPMLLPELTSVLGEISIPEIEGFSLTGIVVTQDGPEHGYTLLSGDLSTD